MTCHILWQEAATLCRKHLSVLSIKRFTLFPVSSCNLASHPSLQAETPPCGSLSASFNPAHHLKCCFSSKVIVFYFSPSLIVPRLYLLHHSSETCRSEILCNTPSSVTVRLRLFLSMPIPEFVHVAWNNEVVERLQEKGFQHFFFKAGISLGRQAKTLMLCNLYVIKLVEQWSEQPSSLRRGKCTGWRENEIAYCMEYVQVE